MPATHRKATKPSPLWSALALALLAVSAPLLPAQTELLDRILAIVDNSIIMESELEDRLTIARARLRQANTPLPPENILQSQVLDQLIVESLMKQRADRAGLQVTSDEASSALQQLAARNGLTIDGFRAQVEGEGTSFEEFLRQFRSDLLIQKAQRAQVGPRVRITDEEIDRFLASSVGEELLAREYLVHHIMLPVEGNNTVVQAKASELLQELRDGANFESLAATWSQARTALEGGSLGWRKPSQLPEALANAVRDLKVGDVTGPVNDGFALHLVRLTDRRGDTVRYAEESRLRHILLKSSALRTLQQASEEILSLRRRLELGEDFASLARVYSEDPNSALSGGDLGWVQAEQLPEAFREAVESAEVGNITDPFQTEAGWHLAQVLEKRTADLTEMTGRNRAYRLLYERKFEEELARYMHEIRNQAYIEEKARTDRDLP